jgi:hypothetical protein
MVEVINIWFAGAVLVENMMNGFQALNWRIVKRSISGWPLGLDLFDFLSRFLSILPAGSFFPLGFDAPGVRICLHFTNIFFPFPLFFF